MSKCEKCYHKKVCINGANYKTSEKCKHFIDEASVIKLDELLKILEIRSLECILD